MLACTAACAIVYPVAEALGGSENVEIVRRHDRVDACLLRFSLTPEHRAHYDETEYVDVPGGLVAKLQAALLSEKPRDGSVVKLCAPRYVARLRFHQGKKVAAFDFCFDCMIMAAHRGDGSEASEHDFGSGVYLSSLGQLFPVEALTSKRPNKAPEPTPTSVTPPAKSR